jgi:hypothetical protein
LKIVADPAPSRNQAMPDLTAFDFPAEFRGVRRTLCAATVSRSIDQEIFSAMDNAAETAAGPPGAAIFGIDFTSAPGARKSITLARGAVVDGRLHVDSVERLVSFADFEAVLSEPGPWVGGFDFPFGLPREFCVELGWLGDGGSWQSICTRLASISRARLTGHCRDYCNARPAGAKFAHRATDRMAGSSPSMKWVNPPVVYMLQEGAPRLAAAGVHLPGLHDGDLDRVALEAYPGVLARSITRASYKNDQRARQTVALASARRQIIDALCRGDTPLAIPLVASPRLLDAMQEDASADVLDAVMCALQAAWGWQRRDHRFGLPPDMDALEGWIVSVAKPGPG